MQCPFSAPLGAYPARSSNGPRRRPGFERLPERLLACSKALLVGCREWAAFAGPRSVVQPRSDVQPSSLRANVPTGALPERGASESRKGTPGHRAMRRTLCEPSVGAEDEIATLPLSPRSSAASEA
jgi:hypothetical protein